MEITEQKSLFPVPIYQKSVGYVEIIMGTKKMTFLTQMEGWKQTQPALETVGKFTMTQGACQMMAISQIALLMKNI